MPAAPRTVLVPPRRRLRSLLPASAGGVAAQTAPTPGARAATDTRAADRAQVERVLAVGLSVPVR